MTSAHLPKGLGIEQLTPIIGAEINHVNLSQPLSEDQIADIRQALVKHKVIFFRDQELSEKQHMAFGKAFGDLEVHPITDKDKANPEVLVIKHNDQRPGQENDWHSDVTWRSKPSLGSALYALEVPKFGGDTLFANMAVAFERLPDDMKAMLVDMQASHDIMQAFAHRFKPERHDEIRSQFPPETHPVIRTHPESGQQAIYVNSIFTTHICGINRDWSHTLLKYLNKQAEIPEYQCRFRWRKGSVAFWDNRSAQHYATSDYYPAKRHMHRVTVAGCKPYYQADAPVSTQENTSNIYKPS